MRVRLTRMTGGSALRTDSVEGETDDMPTVGQPFFLSAPPLVEGRIRLVNTTRVVALHDDGEFTTESGSRYRVETL